MRLLIHGYNYAPELTGIGRYTGEMGAWLAARGHQVTVLTGLPYYPEWRVHPAYRNKTWMREWRDGVEVLRSPFYVPAKVTGVKRLLLELSFGVSCLYWWPQIFSRRWDAVLSICPPLLTVLFPLLLAKRQGIGFMLHFQDLQLEAARTLGILRHGGLLSVLSSIDRVLLHRADMISAISDDMLARLRGNGGAALRLNLMPNWADLETVRPGPRPDRLRKEFGFGPEILVLYAGNMGEKQGLEVILESAAITAGRPDIRYILAGEGVTKARIMELAEQRSLKNVLFLPLQPAERFTLLLAKGDIHLVIQKTSVSDLVMPSKLTNVLAAGRPFIATALPGTELARVTQESQAGLLVAPEDPDALARAILKLADGKVLRQDMGKKGRGYAEAHLSRDIILSRLEGMLQGLARSNGS
jgi:colanic acid biosynthesis glycosyl transferase WcaI